MENTKVLKAYGSHFDIGYTLGRHFKEDLRRVVEDPNGSVQTLLLPFYESTSGRVTCEELLVNTKETFPQYLEEMKGIAEGSATDFIQIFLLNCYTEVSILAENREYKYDEGCSTILMNSPDTSLLVHNEDLPVGLKGVWLCAHIYPDPTKPKQEAIFAYCCAGGLPGGQPNFNMHGLVMTENFLLPRLVNSKGIPRRVMDRAMLSASSVEEAITTVCKGGGFACGGGNNFSQNIDGIITMTNVEFYSCAGKTCYMRTDVKDNVDFHFNEYRHARVDYIPEISTQSRQMRMSAIVKEKGKPKTLEDILHIMGDDAEKSLPIYRTGYSPDTLLTAFTASFNMKDRVMAVYNSNPKTSQPELIPFSRLQSGD